MGRGGVGVLWVCALAQLAHASLVVTAPSSLGRERFTVSLRSKFLGPQSRSPGLRDVALWAVADDEVEDLDAAACSALGGRLALVWTERSTVWGKKEELSVMSGLQACGAVGVVRLMQSRAFFGVDFFQRDQDCCRAQRHEIGIPVTQALAEDAEDVYLAVREGVNVTASLETLESNLWVDIFEHTAFFLFGRVFLAMANCVVAVIAMRACAKHWSALRHVRKDRPPTLFDNTRKLIILTLVLQVCGSVLRAWYCATGPFFSTDALTWLVHNMVINLSMPIQLPIICIVSYIFRRMVNIKRNVRPPKKRYVLPIGFACVCVLVLELVGGYARAQRVSLGPLLLATAVFSLAVVLVSLVVVLAGGIPFLRSLNKSRRLRSDKGALSSASISRHSKNIRAKFARTVVYGAIGVALQVGALVVIALFDNGIHHPVAYCVALLAYYWGFTITALLHTLAFAPIVRVRVIADNIKRSVALQGSKRDILADDEDDKAKKPVRLASAQWNDNSEKNLRLEDPLEGGGESGGPRATRMEHDVEGAKAGATPGHPSPVEEGRGNRVGEEREKEAGGEEGGGEGEREEEEEEEGEKDGGSRESVEVEEGAGWRAADLMDDALVHRVNVNSPQLGLRDSIRLKVSQLQDLWGAQLSSRSPRPQGELGEQRRRSMRKGASTGVLEAQRRRSEMRKGVSTGVLERKGSAAEQDDRPGPGGRQESFMDDGLTHKELTSLPSEPWEADKN